MNLDDELLNQLPNLSAEQLELLVRHHNTAYFELDAPEISDEVFDQLVEALRVLNPDAKVLHEMGSSTEIGRASKTITHDRPMLSLDKCYNDDEFFVWREKIQGDVIAMPKIDGVACSIQYDKHGKIHIAATRGDGQQGEDITDNVKQVLGMPRQIDSQGSRLEVRGEIYMKLSRFNEKYKDQFANPRNLAAGALKQKDAQKSAAYGLSFFPYDLIGSHLSTEEEKFQKLASFGFEVPPVELALNDDACKQAYLHYVQIRHELDYEIDGVVFRANRTSEQDRLGVTAHHPRWAMAYKFQGESAQTHLQDVQWSVARTGIVTPVAVVQPVYVSGATVTRASLHNFGLFQKHHLTQNALVQIVRRGGVIPHLERVLQRGEGDEFHAPSKCPSCGGEVFLEGDFLRCANPHTCPDVMVGRFAYFCTALDIQGFGEKLIRTLVDQKLLVRLGDLYRLTESQLMSLERVGEKLAKKLINELNQKREIEWSEFLTSLGFEEIGPTVSEHIALQFKTLELLRAATQEDLSNIDGIGESIASSMLMSLTQFHDELDDLLTEIRIVKPQIKEAVSTSHVFYDKSVVFTGALTQLERKEAQKRVRALGGHTPSTVTSSTHYLVVGEGKKSTKQKAADKLIELGHDIKIIPESTFMEWIKSV